MRFNNRYLKLAFLTTRWIYWGVRSAPWSAYISFHNRNLKLPFFATRCLYWGKLSNPIYCQFWHHSCIQLKELPPNIVSHTYLIFRNKSDIKYFLFFLTFSYHWEILYEPHCQQCWVKFTHAGHVILQLILYKLWSKMSLWAFQPYKLPILTSQLHPAQRATPKYCVTHLPYL